MKLWPTLSRPSGEKYEIADQPDQAQAYDINPFTLVCQYTASNCNIFELWKYLIESIGRRVDLFFFCQNRDGRLQQEKRPEKVFEPLPYILLWCHFWSPEK